MIPIFYTKLDTDVILPKYSHPGDAGMDIYANEEILIKPQETVLIGTGLKLEIPIGFEIQVRPRSGLSLKTPLRIANSPGTADSGYRGELKVIIRSEEHTSELQSHSDLVCRLLLEKKKKKKKKIKHKLNPKHSNYKTNLCK